MADYIIKGTKVKYLINLAASGFSMMTDDFKVSIFCSGITKEFKKVDCTYDADTGKWYLCFDTSGFRSGEMIATFTAFVPDADFPDGMRTEKDKISLGILKSS